MASASLVRISSNENMHAKNHSGSNIQKFKAAHFRNNAYLNDEDSKAQVPKDLADLNSDLAELNISARANQKVIRSSRLVNIKDSSPRN